MSKAKNPPAWKPGRDKKTPGWIFKTLFVLAIVSTILFSVLGAAIYWHFSRGLPQIITVADYRPLGVTRIVATGGKEEAVIGEFYKERRYLVPYDKIPDRVVKAFISAEDDKFFEHQGINFASMIRASIANFRAGHVVQGGSTITQQVAKSLLLTPEKSFSRKIKEVILASRIEHNLSKQQILYLYLNQIYLGSGAYGVQAAAKTYYHKDISAVTLAEAAILAGMPQAPGKYSPNQNPKRAKERQLYVLRRMYENGFITQAQMTEASGQALKVYNDEDINQKYAAYHVEHIRRYLVEKYGDKAVYEDGLTVTVPTSIELALSARRSLREGLRAVDKRNGYRGPIQHLTDVAEVEKVLKEERISLIEKRLGYQMFLPDGRIDPVESIHSAGLASDAELLEPGELYEAVVTSIDDKSKRAGVMIGAIKAEIPMSEMKWARAIREDKGIAYGPEPTLPSKVLTKGDVVWVHLVKNDKQVVVGLDQEPKVQGAIFSLEAQTGNVLAMEGGYDYGQSEFNRATQALRQPGSSFKPIIYSAALGKGFTPATTIVDSPIVYQDGDSGKWKPSNFEEKFYGDTTFRQALIKSRNVPTIKIVQAIQIPYLISFAKNLGMNGSMPADLSISLGSASVSLADMTRVYALYPRLGRRVDPIYYNTVRNRDGKVIEELKSPGALPPPTVSKVVAAANPSPTPGFVLPSYPSPDDPAQLMDPRVAYVMTNLMKEVVSYGTGHEAKQLGHSAAGKTGTTNEYIDAWFMGFTPQVVTGVWVGYDNHRSIGPSETGARAALPIWLNYMKDAVKNFPDVDFTVPPGVVFASIDPVTGKLAAPNASDSIKEAFIEGTQPTESATSAGKASGSQSEFFKEDIE